MRKIVMEHSQIFCKVTQKVDHQLAKFPLTVHLLKAMVEHTAVKHVKDVLPMSNAYEFNLKSSPIQSIRQLSKGTNMSSHGKEKLAKVSYSPQSSASMPIKLATLYFPLYRNM